MRSSVQKWGNSLAVRIPRPLAQAARLASGSKVVMRVEDGKIVIEPQRDYEFSLDDLLKGVDSRNRHPETDWGGAAGREEW